MKTAEDETKPRVRWNFTHWKNMKELNWKPELTYKIFFNPSLSDVEFCWILI